MLGKHLGILVFWWKRGEGLRTYPASSIDDSPALSSVDKLWPWMLALMHHDVASHPAPS